MKYIKFIAQPSLLAAQDVLIYKQPWDFHSPGCLGQCEVAGWGHKVIMILQQASLIYGQYCW